MDSISFSALLEETVRNSACMTSVSKLMAVYRLVERIFVSDVAGVAGTYAAQRNTQMEWCSGKFLRRADGYRLGGGFLFSVSDSALPVNGTAAFREGKDQALHVARIGNGERLALQAVLQRAGMPAIEQRGFILTLYAPPARIFQNVFDLGCKKESPLFVLIGGMITTNDTNNGGYKKQFKWIKIRLLIHHIPGLVFLQTPYLSAQGLFLLIPAAHSGEKGIHGIDREFFHRSGCGYTE